MPLRLPSLARRCLTITTVFALQIDQAHCNDEQEDHTQPTTPMNSTGYSEFGRGAQAAFGGFFLGVAATLAAHSLVFTFKLVFDLVRWRYRYLRQQRQEGYLAAGNI